MDIEDFTDQEISDEDRLATEAVLEQRNDSNNMAEQLIEVFGHESFLLATHYLRRYQLHKMMLGVVEIDIYDVVAFVVIDQETERVRAYKTKAAEQRMPAKGGSI